MKNITVIVLFFIKSFSTSQINITITGFDNPKAYFKDHYTKHYYAGLFISGGVGWSLNYLTNKKALSDLIGVSGAVLAGVFKEAIIDKRMHLGTCNNTSAYFTFWGGGVSGVINIPIFDLQDKRHLYAKWRFNEVKEIMK